MPKVDAVYLDTEREVWERGRVWIRGKAWPPCPGARLAGFAGYCPGPATLPRPY